MKEESPWEPLFKQIADLISLAKEKSPESLEGKVPPELEERLNKIEDAVAVFTGLINDDLEREGITDEALARKIVSEKDKLPPKKKRDLEKALALGRDAIGLKLALTLAKKQATAPKGLSRDELSKKTKKDEITKRKSKFKKLHGDQRWKKL